MFEGSPTIGSAQSLTALDASGRNDPLLRSARAQQRITALGEMTGGIAHDFRNILAMIASGLALAERSKLRGEAFEPYLQAAQDGIERGLRLTARLLAFAKPESPHLDPHNFNDLVGALALFVKYGAGPGNHIVFDLAKTLPLCLVDPSSFNAAILNLVVNARDAMPDGGEIAISTRRDGAHVVVRVSDTGEGMSADTIREIFDPFFTTKGKIGTGLGVPQVKAFMTSVGGEIRVESEPGIGTHFDLLFPVTDPDAATNASFRRFDRATSPRPRKRPGIETRGNKRSGHPLSLLAE